MHTKRGSVLKRLITTSAFIILVLFTHSVTADSYWGFKTLIISSNASSNTSNAVNIGALMSIDVAEIGVKPLAIEADFDTTVVEGTGSTATYDYTWGNQTAALYTSIRSPGNNYFKVKVGAYNTKTTVKFLGKSSSGTSSGPAYGFGFKLGNLVIDFTTHQDKDDSSNRTSLVSFGFHFE